MAQSREGLCADTDFLSIGKHCSMDDCKQLDFLPFKCAFCKDIFCVEHQTVTRHQCPNAYVKNVQVPVCPLCGQIVKKSRHEDTNQQVNYHIQSGCKELVVSQKRKKENRCSLKGCKRHELIPFHCDKCQRQFCVRHRHEADHACHTMIMMPVVSCA